jgi:hypothetical protein
MTMEPINSEFSPLQAHLKRLWIHGFLAGFGVVLVIFLIYFFIWGWPAAPPEGTEEAKSPPSQGLPTPLITPAPTPPGAEVKPLSTLEAELTEVVAKLEHANQNKDLQQLLSLYSPSFPDLPKKAEEISRSWGAYDYLSLGFKLTDVHSSAPDRAAALVFWKIKTRHRQTRQIKDSTKVYLVQFTRNAGQWRIQSLDKVDNVPEQDKSS